ncbi:hypothetical protein CYLTODRAFT_23420 [Cylindrobasidium torrendii FP15055 ss-10]|uniref:F-box domain-containing protein n=1 Tax=Cylindrobasidium torrendii FP15055 ss-10 TaxID=1314674 RepID=A0A0D7B8D2_9AGAR|nr:hypothetical protein CYLTODRAFT_23420 [Cylindrobasidium torrendii FP15055 ss-10]
MAQEQRALSTTRNSNKTVVGGRTTADSLPPEIKGLITRNLHDLSPSTLKSLGLVWREAWHDIRTIRFEYIKFDDSSANGWRCKKLLSLLRTAPNVATYIHKIFVGSQLCVGYRFEMASGPTAQTRKWLAEILTLASHLEVLALQKTCPVLLNDVSDELGFLTLRTAFQSSPVQTLNLTKYAFATPAGLLKFINGFRCLTRVQMKSIPEQGVQLASRLWQQSLPRNEQLTSLTVGYGSMIDVQFLDLVANEAIFPNISHSRLHHLWAFDSLPVLQRLLLRWPTLNTLRLSTDHGNLYPGRVLMRFPSTLTTLEFSVTSHSKAVDYWALTLYHNRPVERVIVQFSFFIWKLPEDAGLARFDDALAECVGHLDWRDELMLDHEWYTPEEQQRARNWVYLWLPKVAKKFFVGMPPEPVPNVLYQGTFASRFNQTIKP